MTIKTRLAMSALVAVSIAGLMSVDVAQAAGMGDMMNPSKWFGGGGNRDRDAYGPGGYGAPGYGGGPGYGGYGAPGYGGGPGYGGYGAPGYGGGPGYGSYGAPGYGGGPGYGGYGAPGGQPPPPAQ
jgi:hypothetical protein